MKLCFCLLQHPSDVAPSLRRLLEQLPEVHSRCTEHGVELISLCSFQSIAIHPMPVFQMTDPRFHHRSPFHPLPQPLGGLAFALLVHVHFDLPLVAVPSVAPVHKHLFDSVAHHPPHLLQCLFERVSVIRIARVRLRRHVPPSPTARPHAHFHSKLVALVRLAFADAFHLRRMHAVHFAFPLLLINPLRLFQVLAQFFIHFVAFSLNISYHSPQKGLEFLGAFTRSLVLSGMGVAALLEH